MRHLTLASVLIFAAMAVQADGQTDFLAAEQALKSGDRARFEQLSASLRDYPLYPYLRFAELTRNLEAAPDDAIESFIADDPDSQLADRLRLAYLRLLAKASRWSVYVRLYRPDDSV